MINNYNKSFQITENIGNNIFCFDKTGKQEIHIAKLITVDISKFKQNIVNYIRIGTNSVFREEKNSKIIEYKGLNNLIEVKGKNQTIYIVDNHNHALYFRYKEYFDGNIQKGSELIHIDQHTDMNENKYKIHTDTSLDKGMCPKGGRVCKQNLEDIFNFTNYKCNVGNFIKPAIKEGLVGNITQINTEYSLLNIKFPSSFGKHEKGDSGNLLATQIEILDIDLDFRAPEMSIQKYQETINITKKLIQNSRVVTIATSPYFLDQNLAIKMIKDLFN